MSYNVERRQSPRKRFDSLLYVELEPGNGGLVVNFSEHGFGFRAARRVRSKQDIQFAFNLDAKRRLQGRGRLEWTDDDGRLAGVQFTDVSDEFRREIRGWLASASPYTGASASARDAQGGMSSGESKSGFGGEPVSPQAASVDFPKKGPEVHSREAGRGAEAITPDYPAPVPPQAVPFSQMEQISSTPSDRPKVPENPRVDHGLPWAASLPPAVGLERKPSRPMQELVMVPASGSGAPELRQDPPAEHENPLKDQQDTVLTAASIPNQHTNDVEMRGVESLNEHAVVLLKQFQQEEERVLTSFRETTTRLLRDAERRLFPIREAVHAQISNLECSVTSATATAKALDQYPALLEKAQHQALDRFQSQLQEVLRIHVTELRRRSEAILEGVATLHPAVGPKRISTSSAIVVTAIIIMSMVLLFTFRREAATGLIWMGQQLVEPAAAPEVNIPSAKPKNGEKAAPVTATPAPSSPATSNPSTGPGSFSAGDTLSDSGAETDAQPEAAPAIPKKSVRAMWDDVAKGDVATELTLGNMYLTGHGVTKNCYQARRLFAAAAKKGSEEGKQKFAQVDRNCS
jgi:hypothetical protein